MWANETSTITINHRIKVRGKRDEAEEKIPPKIENLILCYYIIIIQPTYANIINRLAIIVEHLHRISFSHAIIPFHAIRSPSSSLFFHAKKRSFTFFKQRKKLTTKWVEWSLNSIKLRRKKLRKIIFAYFVIFFVCNLVCYRQCCGQVDFYRQHSGIVCYHKNIYNIIVADFRCSGMASSIYWCVFFSRLLRSLSLAFDNFARSITCSLPFHRY